MKDRLNGVRPSSQGVTRMTSKDACVRSEDDDAASNLFVIVVNEPPMVVCIDNSSYKIHIYTWNCQIT